MQLKIVFLFFVVAFSFDSLSQNPKADSLKRELTNHLQADIIRIGLLNDLAFEKHFSNPEASLQYSNEARDLSKKLNYPQGLALSYRYTGLALWTQANLSNALEYFLNGLKIADSLHYTQIQADITGNMGLVYTGLGNYGQALHFFETSLHKQRELKNKRREIIMLNNMGDCYYFMKDYPKSLQTYRQSLMLGKPLDFLQETNNRNIGTVFEAMGSLDSALAHYKTSLELTERYNEGKEKAMVRIAIASVYTKKGNYKEAEQLAKLAIQIATSGKYRAQLRDGYGLLSEIEQAQGLYPRSLEHYKKSIAYRDSIQNVTETSRIASVRLEYEMQKKQLEINQLKTDTQLKEKDLSLKNVLLFFSIALVALFAFLIFYVVKNNQLLKVRNQEISKQQDELLALNEEIVSQSEEVMTQRDALVDKNRMIEQINQRMTEVNENLEQLIKKRTQVLEEQNQKLSEYAFFNAHNLRAPLARIMGLVSLLMMKIDTNERPAILTHLKQSSEELDSVVRSISDTLHDGMNVFPDKEK